MNRRDLLKGVMITMASTAMGVASAASVSKNRIFGVPNSARPGNLETDRKRRLRLSMSRNDVPIEMLEKFEALSDFWEIISSDPGNYKAARDIAISSNEHLGEFLQNHQFNTDEHKTLLKLSDPTLMQYANDGDYISLLSAMNSRGLLELGDNLSDHYANALRKDRSALKRLKEEYNNKFSQGSNYNEEDFLDEVLYFQNKIIPTAELNVRNNAVAAVNLAVAVNVAAAVNVALAVALGVAVVVVVSVGVSGCGNRCHGGLRTSGKLQKDVEAVSLIVKKAGNPQIAKRLIIELHCREAAACLSAAVKLGLIRIGEADRKEVYRRLYAVVRKGLEA